MTRGRATIRLGDLQLRIMRVLWQSAPATVAEVQERLDENLAYTTVATMLRKMEDRGLLRHEEVARKFLYWPLVSMQEVTRSMADDLIDRLFAGSLSDAVSHLLETREVSRKELARLGQLIERRRRSESDGE
ncbi:MAG: BlaI/MecI/CopY family transcriptional regulator [Pirellulaceae bacterium]